MVKRHFTKPDTGVVSYHESWLALSIVKSFCGMEQYVMIKTRTIPSIFGMKLSKTKNRREITSFCTSQS